MAQYEFLLIDIPYLHPKVDADDLDDNGKLLSENQIEKLKKYLSKDPDKRYTKKDLKQKNRDLPLSVINEQYSIRKKGDSYFAIYKGEQKGKHLGRGAYGTVKLAQNLETGKWHAIKIINKSYEAITAGDTEKKNLEITGKLEDSYIRKINYKDQYEIIMELAAGSPVDALVKNGRFNPIDFLDMGLGMAESIRHLHQEYRLLHKDIKPENFIHDVTQRQTTPIDLGNSSYAENLIIDDANKGTPFYEAPENKPENKKIFAFSTYTEKTEVYALGLAYAKMIDPNLRKPPASIQDIKFSSPFGDKETQTKLAELIMDMLKENPDERISMDKVCTRWKAIREEYANNHLNIHSMIKNICYLDVNYYMQATEMVKKEILLALHAADVVHLISSEEVNPLSLMKVKHEFALNGLKVFDKSLQYSDEDNQYDRKKMMDARTQQLENEHKINYLAYYLRLPKDIEKKSKPDILPPRVLEFAIDKKSREEIPDYYNLLLEKKVENVNVYPDHNKNIRKMLKSKMEYYAIANREDPRMKILQVSIDKLKRNEELTYKKLLDHLRLLEENLIENRPSKFLRYFEKNFGIFRSNPSAAVHQQIKEIKKDLKIPKKNK